MVAINSNAEALGSAITSLANAIRSKTGLSSSMTLSDMTSAIESISTGGGEAYDEETTFFLKL